VLQYADDTLIIAKASPSTAQHLKHTLQIFANATRLQMNFHKTTFVPMNLSEDLTATLSEIMGAEAQSFPKHIWAFHSHPKEAD
jgi:hypothetical protein